MTIAVQTPRSGPYSGDGATVAFAYGFLIDDEDEIVVVVADANGDETTQTITTHYTVSGVGSNSGGTVTFVTAPAATETISMRRATILDQGVDLQNRGSVVPQVLEDTYDEVVKMVQDLQEQVDRSVLLRVTANVTGIDVPAPSAGQVLGWNAAGDNLQNYTPNSDAYLTTPGSVTDNRVVRFDGTSGEALQESGVTIDDNASISMSTINIDNLNTRIGIGDVSPDTDLDIFTAAPTVRLQDSGDSAIADLIATSPKLLLDIDAAAAVASSAFQIDIDNGQRLLLDENGMVIGTGAADRALRITGTDAIRVPVGTTAQRPSTPEEGDVRRNTTTTQWEGYDGSSWGSLGGAGLFRGNNGTSGDSVNGSGDIFRVNAQTLTVNEEIESGESASAAGPLTVDSGITLTVNGTLVIL